MPGGLALSQHDLLRLLESLRSADGLELVREVAERLLQELIEAEAAARIGAERGERTDTRTTWRNRHREKTATTQAGGLELAIPKLRAGSFFPSLLERRHRIDQALYAAVIEAHAHGVPTRSADDLVKAPGSDTGIPKNEASRIRAGLDGQPDAFPPGRCTTSGSRTPSPTPPAPRPAPTIRPRPRPPSSRPVPPRTEAVKSSAPWPATARQRHPGPPARSASAA